MIHGKSAALTLAPKSNALHTAYGEIRAEIEAHRVEPVPLHLRNAPAPAYGTIWLRQGLPVRGDVEGRVADMKSMPESLRGREFYHPATEGRGVAGPAHGRGAAPASEAE